MRRHRTHATPAARAMIADVRGNLERNARAVERGTAVLFTVLALAAAVFVASKFLQVRPAAPDPTLTRLAAVEATQRDQDDATDALRAELETLWTLLGAHDTPDEADSPHDETPQGDRPPLLRSARAASDSVPANAMPSQRQTFVDDRPPIARTREEQCRAVAHSTRARCLLRAQYGRYWCQFHNVHNLQFDDISD